MAINPLEMMKYAERLRIFTSQHPRVEPFLKDVAERGIEVGSVLEMKVITPEGKEFITNIKVTAEDLETVEMMKKMKK